MKQFNLVVSERVLALIILATQAMSRNENVTEMGRNFYARASKQVTAQAIKQGSFSLDTAFPNPDEEI